VVDLDSEDSEEEGALMGEPCMALTCSKGGGGPGCSKRRVLDEPSVGK